MRLFPHHNSYRPVGAFYALLACFFLPPLTKGNMNQTNQTIVMPVPELKNALAGFSKIISRSSSLPVLRSVRMRRTEQGTISLQATDLDSFVTYQCDDVQPGPELDYLIPFDEFSRTVKGAKERI